jgi:hypothetical protein
VVSVVKNRRDDNKLRTYAINPNFADELFGLKTAVDLTADERRLMKSSISHSKKVLPGG